MEYFPGFTPVEILPEIQKDPKARQINPEPFEGKILFMSVFNDIDWTKDEKSLGCISNSKDVRYHTKRFQRGHRSFLGPGNDEKYETYSHKPVGEWDNEANQMIEHYKQSGHPVFRGTIALNRGILRRKGGINTFHFTAESANIELHFAQFTRQISSVSAEHYRVGVMIWLKRCLVRHPWERTNPYQK